MAGNAVCINADKDNIMILRILVDELVVDEEIQHRSVNATLFEQIGVYAAHIYMAWWELEFLLGAWAFDRVGNNAVAKQLLHGSKIVVAEVFISMPIFSPLFSAYSTVFYMREIENDINTNDKIIFIYGFFAPQT